MPDPASSSASDLRGLLGRIVVTVLLLLILAGPGAETFRNID